MKFDKICFAEEDKIMKARPSTIDKAITRTITYRGAIEEAMKNPKVSYYTKDSPRKIDLRREDEILGKLLTLRAS